MAKSLLQSITPTPNGTFIPWIKPVYSESNRDVLTHYTICVSNIAQDYYFDSTGGDWTANPEMAYKFYRRIMATKALGLIKDILHLWHKEYQGII